MTHPLTTIEKLCVIRQVIDAEIKSPATSPAPELAAWLRRQADILDGKPVEFADLPRTKGQEN
jgi:hypothetical protein